MGISSHELILVLRARDEATRILRGLSGELSNLDAAAMRAAQRQLAHGAALTTAGVGIAAVGIAGAVALNDLADAAIAYNEQAARTMTQTDGITVSMDQLKQMGRDVATELPVQFDQVQGALYDIFSSIDTDAPGAMELLRGIGKAAVAGSVDMETAGRADIAILNAWHMKASDVNHVNDVMFQLVRKGVGTYEEFGSTIGRAIPSAVKAGQSVENLGGMLAFMTRNGLSAAMSATAAARALDAISNPKTVESMHKIGVEVADANGNFRPMVDIVTDLRAKFADLNPEQRAAEMKKLFAGSGGNIQAMRFFNLALDDSTGLLQELTDNMNNAGGAADAAYQIMANTPAAKMQEMNNKWEVMKTVLGDQVLPIKMKIVEVLTSIFDWFTKLSPTTQEWIVKIAALASALAIIVGTIMAVVGVFIMISAAAAIAGISLGAVAATAGIVLAVIAGLVAIGYLIVANWDSIKAAGVAVWGALQPVVEAFGKVFSTVWESIKKTAQDIWNVIGPLIIGGWNTIKDGVGKAIEAIKPHIQGLIDAWNNLSSHAGEIADKIIAVWNFIYPAVAVALYALALVFTVVWAVIANVVSGVVQAIGAIIGGLIDIISGIINFITAVFTGQWGAAWDAILQIVSGAWQMIYGVFSAVVGIIIGVIQGFVGAIIGFFQNLFHELVGGSIIPDMINAIVAWFAQLPGRVLAWVVNLVTTVISWFVNLHNQAVAKVAELANNVISWFQGLPGRVIGAISSLAGSLYATASGWLSNMVNAISGGVGNVISWFSSLPGKILGALGNLGSMLWQAGSNILTGFLNGLKSAWNNVTSFIGGIGTWISQHKGPKAYDLKLLRPAGNWIMESLKKGFQDQMPSFQRQLSGISTQITDALPSTQITATVGSSSYGLPQASATTSIPITIYTQELDPVKHASDLGWRIAQTMGSS
jgi:TP901 family phage tail tape measure protein